MVKENQIIKETKEILTFVWECLVCSEKGKEFKIRSMYESQVKSWKESHMITHTKK